MKIDELSKKSMPIWEYIAKVYKLFSSSKSFWSVTYLLMPFLVSQLLAIVVGTKIHDAISKFVDSENSTWVDVILELIADYFQDSGDWAVVGVVLFVIILMAFVKLIEKEERTKHGFFFLSTFILIFVTLWFFMLPETSRVMSENGKKLDELLEGQSHITDLRNDMNEQKEEIKKLKQEFFALRKSVQEIAPNETEIIDNANQILEEQGYESAIFYLKFQFSYLKHQQVNLSKSEEEKIVENKIDSVQIIEQVKVPPKQTTKTISKITSKTETTLTIDGLVYENIPFTKRYNWDDAKEYCAMKDGDWRLPTRKELHRLSNIEMYGQYDNGHKKWFEENKDKRFKASNGRELFVREEFLENMKNGFYFWTNETRNDSSAWVVYFYFGNDYWNFRTNTYYVLCVSGQ